MTDTISPEQRLFVGVIVNAAMEAAGAGRAGGDHRAIRDTARAWFADADDDFAMVCMLAGYEPRDVRKRVLAYVDRVHQDLTSAVKLRRPRIRAAGGSAITMADVARTAGVSTMTVARALNRTGPCSPSTRARVIEVAQALGYPIGGSTSVH